MIWFLLSVFCVASVLIFLSVWRKWVAPWGQIQEIVEDIKKLQQPKTYLIQGSTEARRVAIALEDIFLQQLQLSRRIHEEEFSVEAILGAMAAGLVGLNERGE